MGELTMTLRESREFIASHDPYLSLFLKPDERKDFIDGKCRASVYEGTVILDYSRPWSDYVPEAGAGQ